MGLAMVAGWLCRDQEGVIHHLEEENRVLRELLSGKRLRFTSAQRRRLATKGKSVGSRGLRGLSCLVTPDTILRWRPRSQLQGCPRVLSIRRR